jgi:hypothetical protein
MKLTKMERENARTKLKRGEIIRDSLKAAMDREDIPEDIRTAVRTLAVELDMEILGYLSNLIIYGGRKS